MGSWRNKGGMRGGKTKRPSGRRGGQGTRISGARGALTATTPGWGGWGAGIAGLGGRWLRAHTENQLGQSTMKGEHWEFCPREGKDGGDA